MASKKPTQPPAFDATSFTNALIANQPISSTLAAQYIAWKRWVESSSQFDSKGLRDVVNANAYYLDSVKDDLDNFEGSVNPQLSSLEARVAALESQPSVPFPGSG